MTDLGGLPAPAGLLSSSLPRMASSVGATSTEHLGINAPSNPLAQVDTALNEFPPKRATAKPSQAKGKQRAKAPKASGTPRARSVKQPPAKPSSPASTSAHADVTVQADEGRPKRARHPSQKKQEADALCVFNFQVVLRELH